VIPITYELEALLGISPLRLYPINTLSIRRYNIRSIIIVRVYQVPLY
jgi:hypothetical protein